MKPVLTDTITAPAPSGTAAVRSERATTFSVLMCPPTHFTVQYAINPWMNPDIPTDTAAANRQWQDLRETYLRLGYDVRVVEPVAGLVDMVFAANGGFTLDGKAYGARFLHAERAPEGDAYLEWFERAGFDVHRPRFTNEGEGDFLLCGETILAGHGFRTSTEAHDEVRGIFDREVVSLRLIDPSYYHLDTALTVLDDRTIAYLPAAFDEAGRAELARRYPDAILVDQAEAAVLGLNAVSDGHTVIHAPQAQNFAAALRARGFETVGVALPELLLGGGGIKCCTQELRR